MEEDMKPEEAAPAPQKGSREKKQAEQIKALKASLRELQEAAALRTDELRVEMHRNERLRAELETLRNLAVVRAYFRAREIQATLRDPVKRKQAAKEIGATIAAFFVEGSRRLSLAGRILLTGRVEVSNARSKPAHA